ncbi:MAG: hypothetical protein ACR2GB_01180 [Nocardioidaceae bacterium]
MNRTTARITTATLALGFAVSTATPALANADDVIHRGGWSGSSDWKLKASPEDGRIEVEGEVDSNVKGQTWRWRILHDGGVSARGQATTVAPSGSFEVRRTVVNAAGTDRIGWRARNRATGGFCRGSVRF